MREAAAAAGLRSLVYRAEAGDRRRSRDCVLVGESGEAAVVVGDMLRGALDRWCARRAGGDPLKQLAVDVFVAALLARGQEMPIRDVWTEVLGLHRVRYERELGPRREGGDG